MTGTQALQLEVRQLKKKLRLANHRLAEVLLVAERIGLTGDDLQRINLAATKQTYDSMDGDTK